MAASTHQQHAPEFSRPSYGRTLRAPWPSLARCMLMGCMLMGGTHATADELADPELWQGTWQAESTQFRLFVQPSGNRFVVVEQSPTGLNWQAGEGVISGSSGSIEVNYQGVVAQVLVQLTSPDSAIVRSVSCQPDYHVICTLVRNQQARFIKIQ